MRETLAVEPVAQNDHLVTTAIFLAGAAWHYPPQ